MGFQQGLSGLNASAKQLDVIGNNVANGNTVGFKGSRTEFADVFANSLASSNTQSGIGVRVANISQQFGQGAITATHNPLDIAITGNGFFRMQDLQGSLSYTRNGQFQLDKDGYVVNNGQQLTGYGVNTAGQLLQGGTPVPLQIQTANIGARATGSSGAADAGVNLVMNLNASKPIINRGTTGVNLSGINLDNTSPDGTVVAIPGVTVQDSLGNNQTLDLYLTKRTGVSNVWDVSYDLNGGPTTAVATPLTFNTAGNLVGGSPVNITATPLGSNTQVILSANFAGITQLAAGTSTGAATTTNSIGLVATDPSTFSNSTPATVYDAQGVSHTLTFYFSKTAVNTWEVQTSFDGGTPTLAPNPLTFSGAGQLVGGTPLAFSTNLTPPSGATSPFGFNVYFDDSTQFGSPFGVNVLSQDGYADGVLTGLSVAKDGLIQGRYSNGQNRTVGQVVLVNFANVQGLQPLGDNRWAETYASGQARVGAPGSTDLGMLQSAALEDSNVDMTAELVNMITAQRSYQANAQTIKTQDQIMQTLVNLR